MQPRQLRLDAVDSVDDIGAGLLEDDEENAALAVGPALPCFMSSGPATAWPMSRTRNGRAVAIGDDDILPVLQACVSWSLA